MATRGTPSAEGAPQRDRAPCSRAASPGAAGARARSAASPTLTPPSAPAATARPSSPPRPMRACSASTAIPTAIAAGALARRTLSGPPDARRRALRRSRPHRARGRLRARRRRRARHRRLLDAARRSRARLLLPGATARSTCAWPDDGDGPTRRRCRQRRPRKPSSPTSSSTWARSAARAASPAPSSARRRQQPFARTSRARRARRARAGPREDRRPACGDAHVPGAAHLRQRRAGRAGSRALAPPSACWRPAAGSSSSPSTRSRTGSSSSSSRDRAGSGRARARAICRRRPATVRAPSFRFVNHRPLSPTDKEVAANPRARSAKLRWAVRTDAPAWAPDELDPAVPRIGG